MRGEVGGRDEAGVEAVGRKRWRVRRVEPDADLESQSEGAETGTETET